MSGLTYEAVAMFAQQGGTVFFGLMFFCGLIYALWRTSGERTILKGDALWPRHGQAFQRLAQLPLEDDEAPDV